MRSFLNDVSSFSISLRLGEWARTFPSCTFSSSSSLVNSIRTHSLGYCCLISSSCISQSLQMKLYLNIYRLDNPTELTQPCKVFSVPLYLGFMGLRGGRMKKDRIHPRNTRR